MGATEATGELVSQFENDRSGSEIQEFFSGKTILLTGSTGFLGKVLLEKLLRSCGSLKKVYILVREKKCQSPEQRIKKLLDVPAFGPLREQQPNFIDKISICVGDCQLPYLGLSEKDQDLIKNDVNCILHCAAEVRFNASLREATYINVRTMQDLLKIAKHIKQLTSFVHVSTAYSFCPRKDIDEVFYQPTITGKNLIHLVDTFSDDKLAALTPILLDKWPNTYAFTKSVVEDVIKTEGKGLPISIVRPSMVTACLKEPLPGWIDNIYGPTGVLTTGLLGLIRTLYCNGKKIGDLVPADYVVNTIIAACWNAGRKSKLEVCKANVDEEVTYKNPTIFNYVSGCQNPITWNTFTNLGTKHGILIPSALAIWHQAFWIQPNRHVYFLSVLFLHIIPAHIADFLAICIGKKPRLVNAYKKIEIFSEVISYFAIREWNFKNTNVQNLWRKMNSKDKELFEFDINRMDWDSYIKDYITGVRIYLLNDPLNTLPQGRRKAFLQKIAHYVLLTGLCLLLYKLLKIAIDVLM